MIDALRTGKRDKPRLVLDPPERVSEIVFGVLMALTFTGSLSVATAGKEEIGTMLAAAIACNLAWGLTDAVAYLIDRAIAERRQGTLLRRLRATLDPSAARDLIAEELPESLRSSVDEPALEALRTRLIALPLSNAHLTASDFAGACGVFGLIVLTTFHLVIPFLVFENARLALRVSNALALATLFGGGFYLGRYSGGSPWRYGFGLTVVGVALVSIITALGG